MQLQVGDKFTDESGEWEVIERACATAGGKSTKVRVQRVDKPGVTETRTWGSEAARKRLLMNLAESTNDHA
jgi:hypothetical protein